LRCKTPEAQGLLVAEREGVFRRHLPGAHDAGSAHPCDRGSNSALFQLFVAFWRNLVLSNTKEERGDSKAEMGVSLLHRQLKPEG
jgi:hypothetical protein